MVTMSKAQLMFKVQEGKGQPAILTSQEVIEMYGLFTVWDSAWCAMFQKSVSDLKSDNDDSFWSMGIMWGLMLITFIEAPIRILPTLILIVKDLDIFVRKLHRAYQSVA